MSSSLSPPDATANVKMETETETDADATLASSESLQTDMPLTMAASVVLEHLPRDAHTALSKAGLLEQDKSMMTFSSLSSSLSSPSYPLSSSHILY
jgi:ubiquitin-like protein ATG12